MKLSIIYQHKSSESRETIKSIIAQLDDECELIISTQNNGSVFKEFKAENVKAVRQRKSASLDFKNALKAAQGDYIAFIFDGDKISDDYVKSILAVLGDGDKAYYPLKWQFVNWHNFAFCGSSAASFLFANVYKYSVALKSAGADGSSGLYKALAEYKSGEPIEKIIYKHWRE